MTIRLLWSDLKIQFFPGSTGNDIISMFIWMEDTACNLVAYPAHKKYSPAQIFAIFASWGS